MARDVFINFGGPTADTHKAWNDGDLSNIGDGPTNMVDGAGVATGFACICTAIRSGQSSSGVNAVGSGAAAFVDEAIISERFEYAGAGNTAAMELRELDESKTYNIALFASWAAAGNRRTQISVDGFGTVADTVEASLNSTQVALATGISLSSGVITLMFRPFPGDAFAHCNAIWLHENDAPAPGSTILPLLNAYYS